MLEMAIHPVLAESRRHVLKNLGTRILSKKGRVYRACPKTDGGRIIRIEKEKERTKVK